MTKGHPLTLLPNTKRRILLELKGGGVHGYELAKRLGMSVTAIYPQLRSLSEDKLISAQLTNRRKVYTLTDKGRKLLAIIENSD